MSGVNELVEVFFKRYLPRNEIVYRLPVGMTIAEFWPEELAYRKRHAVELPLKSFDGHPYRFVMTADFERAADRLAEIARTEMLKETPVYTADESAVIDEAFFSSVIEGVYSTRQRAHEFIRSGETPKDKNEQMILNNYAALRFVLDHLDGPINEAVVLEIGRLLTENTLESGTKPGYRDGMVYVKNGQQEIVYTPPKAEFVRPMMQELLHYIADPEVHPIIKACAAHIYFVTIHPFFDGNGRTARALSYMILLQAGYDFLRQFPISGVLSQERAKYYKAIRASQDTENGYDFTYFLEYYAGMIERGTQEIHDRVAGRKKVDGLREILSGMADGDRLVRGAAWLTDENIPTITAEKWKNKFKVSFETARQDLLRLAGIGFLRKRTVGRKNYFDVQ